MAATAAQVKRNTDVRIGVGVGVGAGGLIAILLVVCVILMRRRAERNRRVAELDARQRWESEFQSRLSHQRPGTEHKVAELGDGYYVAEADEGHPREAHMLESTEATRSSRTLGGSLGTAKSVAMQHGYGKPVVPDKDDHRARGFI